MGDIGMNCLNFSRMSVGPSGPIASTSWTHKSNF